MSAVPPVGPRPQLFHHRLGEGLGTVAKQVALFFPPDYQLQQSVREWLCSLSLNNTNAYKCAAEIIPVLDERIAIEDRMGLEGAAILRGP